VIYNWEITEGSSSFTEMQRCQKGFNEVRPGCYPLTTVEDMTSDDIWMAYQLHRLSNSTGFVIAFRREGSEYSSIEYR